jgi:hypothetical protein
MRPALAITALVSCGCLAALLAESPAQALFTRLRANVRGDLARVPRYTCVETVTRKQFQPQYGSRPSGCPALIAARAKLASSGLLVWHDRLRVDVAVGENSEMFSWAGARQFETGEINDLAAGGASGSGDFGAFLASVFGADAEGFTFNGEKDMPFGHFAEFEFVVPLKKSHYSYKTPTGANNVIGYGGKFYAAPATAELKRLAIEANNLPPGDVCHIYDTMDYNRVKVGSNDFLLPEVSRMTVLYKNGDETENETHYSSCHEFTGESTIRFDDPDEAGTPAAVAKAALKALPPRTQISVKIDPPIDSATAAAGDPITGVVEHEVKQKGQVIVRTTDKLHGRILRLEQWMIPAPRWIVAIRFESIERDGVELPVSFRPLDDGDRTPQPARATGFRGGITVQKQEIPERPAGGGIFSFLKEGNLVLDRKFHSVWETK